MSIAVATEPLIEYPDSDGLPMSDNPLQFDWIAILKWNAAAYFRDDPNVYVAGDHLIYTVEGNNKIRQAPDVYVAFGPAKEKYRGSYKVWQEQDIFPQVIFEIWSPSNTKKGLAKKFKIYQRFGAEEYYIIYPFPPASVEGWLRNGETLVPIPRMNGHVSPRLGFRFELHEDELRLFGPDGQLLQKPDDIAQERKVARREREAADRRSEAADRRREAADRRSEAAEREREAAKLQQELAERERDEIRQRLVEMEAELRRVRSGP